jgi:hypothetical protein
MLYYLYSMSNTPLLAQALAVDQTAEPGVSTSSRFVLLERVCSSPTFHWRLSVFIFSPTINYSKCANF